METLLNGTLDAASSTSHQTVVIKNTQRARKIPLITSPSSSHDGTDLRLFMFIQAMSFHISEMGRFLLRIKGMESGEDLEILRLLFVKAHVIGRRQHQVNTAIGDTDGK